MALQDTLQDKSIAIAKRLGHESVEPCHVRFAVVQHLQDPRGPHTARDLDRARAELPAPGSATRAPQISEAGAALLAGLTSLSAAVAAFPSDESARKDDADATESKVGAPSRNTARGTDTEALASAMAELDALVGLQNVKDRIHELVALGKFNAVRLAEGLPPLGAGLHLVFTGAPGTGKTTVARIVAKIYRAMGLLPKGQLVKASSVHLIGEYVGHTAVKTQGVVDNASGGVLFIDEAYSLVTGGSYGAESLATLMKAMEDNRDSLAVIAAGYSDEMNVLIDANPGLRSRFQIFIEFPDYTPDELAEIFKRIAASQQVECPPEIADAIRARIEALCESAEGGNARFVRSLFEGMTVRMALRAHADGKVESHEVRSFAVEDVPEAPSEDKTTFGFGV